MFYYSLYVSSCAEVVNYVQECEELMAKGITGTGKGFDLPGRRLGGLYRQPPLSSLRKTTLAAAEKRVRLGSLLPSGPKRLGGDSTIMGALSPVQAAAMAAERRLQDDIWCGSQSCELLGDGDVNSDPAEDLVCMGENVGSSRGRDHSTLRLDPISRKRSRESDSNFSIPSDFKYVDQTVDTAVIGAISKHQTRSQGSCSVSERILHSTSNSQAGSSTADSSVSSSKPLSGDNRTLTFEEPSMWECLMCTLLNRVSIQMYCLPQLHFTLKRSVMS